MPLDYDLRRPILVPNGDATVRLSYDARKCVVFLGKRKLGSDRELECIYGTGFFVAGSSGVYLVTAWHVAHIIQDGPLDIRFNARDGTGRLERVETVKWAHHSDRAVDIAVVRYQPPDWADFTVFPIRGFLTEEKLEAKDTGAGDLAYVVGLFYPLAGERRNLITVHTGHVALMPDDEPIPIEDWRLKQTIYVNGYLVESVALPGSSGSPVFIRRSIEIGLDKGESKTPLEAWVHGSVWLLGLWQGAWKGKPDDTDPDKRKAGIVVPAGIGVVVPAIKILETLKPLIEEADNERREADGSRAASLHSLSPTTGDNPSHKEDFTRLVGAAAKSRKRDDQT